MEERATYTDELIKQMESLTPKRIVEELDKYIVGQDKAKRAVAIALRNRVRRKKLPKEMQDEIAPKNIIMIGPTGVGKTEIARRISKLVRAPFLKVEATKYTEVGYVGRDVESMIRDLAQISFSMVREEMSKILEGEAEKRVEERILDILVKKPRTKKARKEPRASSFSIGPIKISIAEIISSALKTVDGGKSELMNEFEKSVSEEEEKRSKEEEKKAEEEYKRKREEMREKLRNGELENMEIDIEIEEANVPPMNVFSPTGVEEIDFQFQNYLNDIFPKKIKRRRLPIKDARKILLQQEIERLLDMDKVVEEAIRRVEEMGIIFIDEIDKIAGREAGRGPDVSREGVQRDLLPIIEGTTVMTKYGMVKTDHILFIAAGAFHVSKPSDLIPELQGRFPIRVELDVLTYEDFKRILVEPKNALIKQYQALLETEGLKISFTDSAVEEIAKISMEINSISENIGARRLHTVMEKLLEDISFEAPDYPEDKKHITIDENYVREKLSPLLKEQDIAKYII